MFSNIIRPGSRVELCIARQIEQEERSGQSAHILKSQVTDLFENNELELSMPLEAGKLVMLPSGIRLELVFYVSGGLYRGIGTIKERYKTDHMHLFRVALESQLHKYQRREYYRMPCVIAIHYYDISQQYAFDLAVNNYQALVDTPEIGMTRKDASIVDISGGGVRFVADAPARKDSYIMIEVRLHRGQQAKTYLIPARILSSSATQADQERFENRAEFIIRDRIIREEIIRYIFDEERKIRNKEKERSSDAL